MHLPIGTILIWENDTIPTDWAVCDGNNGTPNLVGKLVRGAVSDGERRVTGGNNYHNHSTPNTGTRGSHNHGGSKSFSASGAGSVTGTDGTGATDSPQSHGHTTVTADSISSEDSHAHSTPSTDNNTTLFPRRIKRVFIRKVA